jgi:hypothetical protein
MRAVLFMLACAATVPTPAPGREPPPVSGVLRAREHVVVQLDRELSTREAKAGERFTARVVTRVAGLPPDARVGGTVVEAHRGSEDRDPLLHLRIDDLRDGRCRWPLHARIASADLETGQPPPEDSFRGGAIIGAVSGAMMMRMPGAVGGFGIGFTGGAVKEARNAREDAHLDAGALMELQLTSPLDVRAGCQRVRMVTRPSAPPM